MIAPSDFILTGDDIINVHVTVLNVREYHGT